MYKFVTHTFNQISEKGTFVALHLFIHYLLPFLFIRAALSERMLAGFWIKGSHSVRDGGSINQFDKIYPNFPKIPKENETNEVRID